MTLAKDTAINAIERFTERSSFLPLCQCKAYGIRPPRRSTIHEVAQRAGVSNATVSNVLGDKGRASPEVQQRVRQIAAELGYQTDRAASQLRSGKSSALAAVVPSLENPFFTALLASIERAVSRSGYDLIVGSANEDEATESSRVAALLSWRPAGLFVVPTTDRFNSSSLIVRSNTPFVVIDRVNPPAPADSVLADNIQAGWLAADHLIGLGNRRLLILATSLDLGNMRERCQGIIEATSAAGLPQPLILQTGRDRANVARTLSEAIATHDLPDAIIGLTNFVTLGALAACKRLELKIPRDVALVGFDDYAWMQMSEPSITAIRQPIEAMGTLAWQALGERIAGLDCPPRPQRLACTIEIRDSAQLRQQTVPERVRKASVGR